MTTGTDRPVDVRLDAEAMEYVRENRRYVPRREVVAYILFDVAQTFPLDAYADIKERFNLDVLHVSLALKKYVDLFGGIWDAVNDVLIGGIVDRTRTRWGKFKPYLVALAIPGTIGSCLYWLMPLFFSATDETAMGKFAAFFAVSIINETVGTFRSIARTGMLATISPHPVERTRLITLAEVLSFGDNVPRLLMSGFIDLINNKKISMSMKSLYVGMGSFATVAAGLMSFYFALVAHERIIQTPEPPQLKQSLRALVHNKPMLLITLSEFLGSFSLSTGMTNYYIDVLGSASIKLIVGIPGGFVSTPSYAWVPWMRRKFQTRTLWILGAMSSDALMFLVFLFGSIGGVTHGLYKKIVPMIVAITIQETLAMVFWGVRKVIPQEMFNEAMDYGEWKNGYRNEGMMSVIRGLAAKFVSTFGQTIKTWLMDKMGYDQQAGFLGQTDRTKYYLFAMATALPFASNLLSLIPKLLYDLGGKKRDLMYAELLARREEAGAQAGRQD
ncbi:MAG: MFS transporter [Clostridia bacterium]|nr:MFS transporter [Clostridia bacterium]